MNMVTNKENQIMPLGAVSLLDCYNRNNNYSEAVSSQNNSIGRINASSTCMNANFDQSQTKAWADKLEDLASNVEFKNANSLADKSCKAEERFFVVKRQEGSFDKTFAFLIHKSIQGCELKAIKKLTSCGSEQ